MDPKYQSGKRAFIAEMRAPETEQSRTIEISCASDQPVERWFGKEKFSMQSSAIRMQRMMTGAPLLWNHDPDEIIGVVEKVWLDQNKLRASVRFSTSEDGEEKFKDVLDGIIRNVSIGYMVHEMQLESSSDEGGDTYLVTDWEPYEISFVSVPADTTVGVGRSLEEPLQNEQTNKPEIKLIENNPNRSNLMTPEERTKVNADIEALGKRHKMPYQFAIEGELTLEQYRGYILDSIGNSKPLYEDQRSPLTPKEIKTYNIANAARSILTGQNCFEREVSQELTKRTGQSSSGLLVPFEVLASRAYSATGVGTGAELVGTAHLGSQFIDAMRNFMVSSRVGARILTGLRENISIPKLATAGSLTWGTETASAADSGATTGSVTMSPKRAAAKVRFSRQLLFQSIPAIDQVLQDDLVQACGLGLDKVMLQGTGTNQPFGIVNNTDVNPVDGGQFGYLSALEMIQKVLEFSDIIQNLNWVTTPEVWAILKKIAIAANYPAFLMDPDNTMLGYQSHVSNQLKHNTNKYLILGDFTQVLMGIWGDAADLVVDDKTLAETGEVRIVANIYADVALRHPKVFSVSSNVSLT